MTERQLSGPSMAALLERIDMTGGFDAIAEKVADGVTLKSIAAMFRVTRGQLARAIDAHPEGKKLIEQARRIGVTGIVEDAFEGVKHASPDATTAAKNEFDAAMKLASVLDRETFGQRDAKAGLTLNLNVSDLHLMAVKQVGAEVQRSRPAIEHQPDPPRLSAEDLIS